MAVSSRVVLNRSKLTELELAIADGVLAVAQAVVDRAKPPDATPFGTGLVTSGGTMGYYGGRKIGGTATKKPRSFRPGKGIAAVAGFGFPGRFQETGTVHHAAQPFLGPAAASVVPDAPEIMAAHVRPKLAGRP